MKVTTDACLFGAWASQSAQQKNLKYALDIGSGTGLLSLMLAQKNTALSVDAIEIDPEAALQASQNMAQSPWSNRLTLLEADARLFNSEKKYDLIISNPPFYEGELKSGNAQKNKAHHDEGLLLGELLECAERLMHENGVFCLLLPYKRLAEATSLLFQHQLGIIQLLKVRQSVAHNYFRVMMEITRSKNKSAFINETELSITDEEKKYTTGFLSLLQDYYLHL